MKMKLKKTAIIIPAYNEEKRISRTLATYYGFFKVLKNKREIDFKIIVIINNTTDKTEEIVKKYCKRYREISYLNFKQGGKGFAVIEGFKEALRQDFELLGFVDADMATMPEAFYELIKNIVGYDGVIASRGLKESRVNTSFTRKLTNRGFNFVVRSLLFLPYRDSQCGAKLFTKKAIESVINELGITNWAFDVDLLYKLRKKGFKIKEIPTEWEDKKGSKLSLIKVPFQMFSAIVRLRLLYSPFSFIVKFYDKLPERIKIHNW